LVARVMWQQRMSKLGLTADGRAVDFGDRVAGTQARLIGRRARLRGRNFGRQRIHIALLERDAQQSCVQVFTALEDGKALENVAQRYRKADARVIPLGAGDFAPLRLRRMSWG